MSRISSVITEDADTITGQLAERLNGLAGKHLLITGAGGFLCSYFLDMFDGFNRRNPDNPLRITALDNFKSGLPERVAHLANNPYITFITHDVTQDFKPKEKVDFIIHGASIASPVVYRRFPLETIDVNVNGTWRMLELAKEHNSQSFICFSSSEIYGDPTADAIPTDEEYRGNVSCTGPRACYDESKRLGETLCLTYWRQHNTPVKIIRPFNVYGPGQRLDDKRIIPDLMTAAIEQKPITLFSDGSPTRSFCYASDFCAAVMLIMLSDANGEAFNVGNDAEISMGDAAKVMAEIAATPPLEVVLQKSKEADYLTDNPQRRCPNLTKVRTMMDWAPRVDLREGLSRTLRAHKEVAKESAAA